MNSGKIKSLINENRYENYKHRIHPMGMPILRNREDEGL